VLFRVPAPSSDPAGQRLAARIAERDDWNGHFSIVVITFIARIGEFLPLILPFTRTPYHAR
jgi:hypothetical protein